MTQPIHYIVQKFEPLDAGADDALLREAGFTATQTRRVFEACTATALVVAKRGARPLGCLFVREHGCGHHLRSLGTFVLPRARRQGVALGLWRAALEAHPEVYFVKVVTVTESGWRLMRKVRRQFPNVEFDIQQSFVSAAKGKKGRAA